MRFVFIFVFIILSASCAQMGPNSKEKISASTPEGLVVVSAVKSVKNQEVCFDILIQMKNADKQKASTSNWNLAWVDRNNHYHLLNLRQRNPASIPQGSKDEWSNKFRTCTAKAQIDDVTKLILTPKSQPYSNEHRLELNWK